MREALAPAVYEAAVRWVGAALRNDDSLFTPGVPIWSAPVIADLYERFAAGDTDSWLASQLAAGCGDRARLRLRVERDRRLLHAQLAHGRTSVGRCRSRRRAR